MLRKYRAVHATSTADTGVSEMDDVGHGISFKGTPTEALWGATLGFFIGFAAVSLFGPTAHRFKEVMDLSPTLVGLLVAIPMLTGSLFRIPFSAWVDTTGGRKPFVILLLLSIGGMIGLLMMLEFLYPEHLTAAWYPLVLLFGALAGCGIATFSVGISQVSYWFPQERQGVALGTYAGLGNTAPGLISFALPLVIGAWGLGGAYLAWLGILIVGTMLYANMGRNAWYFQLREHGRDAQEARRLAEREGQALFPRGTAKEALVHSARVWKTWALVGLYFTTFGGFLALTAWLPTYWLSYFGTSMKMAGVLTAGFSLLASFIRVPGGSWSDRFGGERVLALSMLSLLVGAVIMTLSGAFGASVAGEILIGIGMGVGNAAVFKLVPKEIPDAVGGAAGWVGGLGAFGGFVVPPILGHFVAAQGKIGYAHGFSVYIGLSVLCLGITWILSAAGRRRHAAQAARI